MLFLEPYVNFSWHNNPLGNNKYDSKDKIRQMWYGLFLEYGLTKNITLGFDTYLEGTLTSKDGKIFGKPKDRSFSLQYLFVFGRYNFINDKHFALSLFTGLTFPSFGTGTGKLDNFGHYNQWGHEIRLETGWKFDNEMHSAITFNIGYKAQYNSKPSRDILTLKITYFQNLPWWDTFFYGYIKKNTYINKGNNLYGFINNNTFDLEAFNFINNTGYVAFDIMLGKKIGKGKYIILAYSHSFHSKITGNEGMNYNFRAFWVEFMWWINTN